MIKTNLKTTKNEKSEIPENILKYNLDPVEHSDRKMQVH